MGTKNQQSTKFFSNAQEEYISKLLGGRKVAGSGSPNFCAGDVIIDDFLIECKTSMKPKSSFSIKKDWIDKNERERKDSQLPYSALCFQFEPNGENYFVVNERTFKILYENLQENN